MYVYIIHIHLSRNIQNMPISSFRRTFRLLNRFTDFQKIFGQRRKKGNRIKTSKKFCTIHFISELVKQEKEGGEAIFI